MKNLCAALVGWILAVSTSPAENSLIPIEPISGSIASYVDKDGYVNPIVSLGRVDFGGGLSLPLVLNFSSAVRSPSPEFGQGWDCPLFDAKVFDVQPNLKRMETLGGKDRYLIHNQRTENWKHFFTDDWTAKANGEDFEITYKTGCQFVFHNGLISSLTTPDGRTILWNRDGAKLVSLQESGRSPALKITYDSLGVAKQMLVYPDKLGTSKTVYDLSSDLVFGGIDKIKCPGGRVITFSQTRDADLNPIVKWTDTRHLPITLSWDNKTGKILSDDKYSYQITEVSDAKTWPQMARKNKVTGTLESYYFNQKNGVTDETLPDGTTRHIEMIQEPGPNYKAVRLIQDTKNGKVRTVLRRSFDEQGHLLLEAIGLASGRDEVKQYVYDDAGRVVSLFLNGKEVWKNLYDSSTGQLIEREVASLGVKVAFEHLPGGDVLESVRNSGGNVISTQKLAPNNWQTTSASMQRIE